MKKIIHNISNIKNIFFFNVNVMYLRKITGKHLSTVLTEVTISKLFVNQVNKSNYKGKCLLIELIALAKEEEVCEGRANKPLLQ